MVNDPNLVQADTNAPANGSKPEAAFFDTKAHFEAWLDELRPILPLQVDHDPPDFIVECDFGSDCDILFEGVLHLKGFFAGNIRSPGTLVTGPGIINANIEVATAIIGSFGTVSVTATERVLLRGNVSVAGTIRSNSLSIREGAIFDGDCSFLEILALGPEGAHLPAGEAASGILIARAAAD